MCGNNRCGKRDDDGGGGGGNAPRPLHTDECVRCAALVLRWWWHTGGTFHFFVVETETVFHVIFLYTIYAPPLPKYSLYTRARARALTTDEQSIPLPSLLRRHVNRRHHSPVRRNTTKYRTDYACVLESEKEWAEGWRETDESVEVFFGNLRRTSVGPWEYERAVVLVLPVRADDRQLIQFFFSIIIIFFCTFYRLFYFKTYVHTHIIIIIKNMFVFRVLLLSSLFRRRRGLDSTGSECPPKRTSELYTCRSIILLRIIYCY